MSKCPIGDVLRSDVIQSDATYRQHFLKVDWEQKFSYQVRIDPECQKAIVPDTPRPIMVNEIGIFRLKLQLKCEEDNKQFRP